MKRLGVLIPISSLQKDSTNTVFTLSVQFSRSVVSDSLWPHEPQHSRPPCPSPTAGVYPNPCPFSQWCHATSNPLSSRLLLLSIFPSIRVFSNESAFCIRWPKYKEFQHQDQSFQWIFRVDFLWDWWVWSPCSPRDSQESSPTSHFKYT